MAGNVMVGLEGRAGMPPLSLRSPLSYPVMTSGAAGAQPGTGPGNQEVKSQNGHSPVEEKEQNNTERRQRIKLDNVLSMGNHPAIFSMTKPPPRVMTCHHCGLHGSLRCSGCSLTNYCSKECQARDWKSHSIICQAAKSVNGEKSLNKGNTKASAKPDNGAPPPHPPTQNSKEPVRITLRDLQPEILNEGMEMKCYVSEFLSPSNFYVQAFNSRSVETLMKLSILNNIYTKPENIRKDYVPEPGEVCVARYTQDQKWYRVLVYSVERMTKMAQVLYIDFGNQESVSLDDLQPMHRDVDLAPPSAINCCLANALMPPCGWSPECLVHIKTLLTGQQHLMRIVRIDQEELPRYVVDVSLLESGECVSKIMMEKGYSFVPHTGSHVEASSAEAGSSTEKTPQQPTEKQDQPSAAPGSPDTPGMPDRERFKILITVFHNPEMMFCQRVNNAKQLAELCAEMNRRCSALPAVPAYLPDPGEVCCAQFTEDNNWYRASVLKRQSEDSMLVGYLDFGNTETLPVSRLRPIDTDMLATPFQAAQCCLAGVAPPAGAWSPEAIQAIGRLLLYKVFTAEVVSQSEGVLILDLTDESEPPIPISQHLIEAGLAEAAPAAYKSAGKAAPGPGHSPSVQSTWAQLPLGQEVEVVVCMLQNPGEFFCHIFNPADALSLNDLNAELGQYCAQHVSDGYTPVKGDVCGAYFSGDGNWYRGQVMDSTSGGAVVVQFLDYGNSEEVTPDKLCKIPSTYLELPFQAVSCSLAGVKPVRESWDPDSIKVFQKAVVGVKLRAKAIASRGNGFSVELAASESSQAIADVLIAEGGALADDPKKATLGVPPTKRGPDEAHLQEEGTGPEVTSEILKSSNEGPYSATALQPTHRESSSPTVTNSANHILPASSEPQSGDITASNREYRSADMKASHPRGRLSGYTSPPSEYRSGGITLSNQRGNPLGYPSPVSSDYKSGDTTAPNRRGGGYTSPPSEYRFGDITSSNQRGNRPGYTSPVSSDYQSGDITAPNREYRSGDTTASNRRGGGYTSPPSEYRSGDITLSNPRGNRPGYPSPVSSDYQSGDSTAPNREYRSGDTTASNRRGGGHTSPPPPQYSSGHITASNQRGDHSGYTSPPSVCRSSDITTSKPREDHSGYTSPPSVCRSSDITTSKPRGDHSGYTSPTSVCRSSDITTSKPREDHSGYTSPTSVCRSSDITTSKPRGDHSGYTSPPSVCRSSDITTSKPREDHSVYISPEQRGYPNSTAPAQKGLYSPNPGSRGGRSGPSSPQTISPTVAKAGSPTPRGVPSNQFCPPSSSYPDTGLANAKAESSAMLPSALPSSNLASGPNNYSSSMKASTRDTTQAFQSEADPANSRVQHGNKTTQRGEEPSGDSAHRGGDRSLSYGNQQAASLHKGLPKEPSSATLASTGSGEARSWRSVTLPLNEALAASVLKVESPDLIYIFPKENRVDVERLQRTMLDMFTYCTAEPELPDYRPAVGDVCCARFTGDGQWYRAIVLDVSDSTADVAYADYGNMEALPFSCLRPVKEGFLDPPVQTTCCRLDGVTAVNQSWPCEATQALKRLLPAGEDVMVTARSVDAGIYSVSVEKMLESGVKCVEEKLVKESLAKYIEAVSPSTMGCNESGGGCCCQELRKRVDRLELLLGKFLQREI